MPLVRACHATGLPGCVGPRARNSVAAVWRGSLRCAAP